MKQYFQCILLFVINKIFSVKHIQLAFFIFVVNIVFFFMRCDYMSAINIYKLLLYWMSIKHPTLQYIKVLNIFP